MDPFFDMDDNEKKALEELREKMKDDVEPEIYEDINIFYRFLKARDFDLNKAEDMLRKHMEWLKRIDLKNFVLPEVVEKYYSYNYLGYDKDGNIIRYSALGNIDSDGLLNSVKFEDIERVFVHMVKEDELYMKAQAKKLKKHIKCLMIVNMENLTFRKVTDKRVLQAAFTVITGYEKNYPERLKAGYVLNGSVYITVLYNILKWLVGASILQKVHFYSDDSWKEDILKEVDADVLPAFLGGNRTDPDGNPRCLTFVNHGGPVPEKYFIHRSKRSLSDAVGVKKITLSKASFHEEILAVKEPGSYLEWEFETKCRDIGFGIFYEDTSNGEEKMIPLVPIQRIETEEYSETGRYLCEQIGNYVVLFDNSYSWVRAKEIYYRIKVICPEEEKSQFIN